MEWGSERRGDVVVVAPAESIDHGNADEFHGHLVPAVGEAAKSGRRLVIDLAEVGYMSSVGLRALTRAAKVAREESVSIVVANLNGTMAEIFQITRFDKLFGVFDSVEAAVEG